MYFFVVFVLPFIRRPSLINDDATTLLENGDFEEASDRGGVGAELIVFFYSFSEQRIVKL